MIILESELITFLLIAGTLLFIIFSYSKLRDLAGFKILLSALILLAFGWFFTVIEGIFFEEFFNLVEHISYLLSTIALCLWIIITIKEKKIYNEPNSDN